MHRVEEYEMVDSPISVSALLGLMGKAEKVVIAELDGSIKYEGFSGNIPRNYHQATIAQLSTTMNHVDFYIAIH